MVVFQVGLVITYHILESASMCLFDQISADLCWHMLFLFHLIKRNDTYNSPVSF